MIILTMIEHKIVEIGDNQLHSVPKACATKILKMVTYGSARPREANKAGRKGID